MIRPEDFAPDLVARMHPSDVDKAQPGPDEDLSWSDEFTALMRRLDAPFGLGRRRSVEAA